MRAPRCTLGRVPTLDLVTRAASSAPGLLPALLGLRSSPSLGRPPPAAVVTLDKLFTTLCSSAFLYKLGIATLQRWLRGY